MSNFDRNREVRRLSEIEKIKKTHEDSQEVKFIEDLRSAGISPPERKPKSNEEFSSDKIHAKNPGGLNL